MPGRKLRIWEVISVIQDLPYTRQVEILSAFDIDSQLIRDKKFKMYYEMSDERLSVGKSRLITKLSAVYLMVLASGGNVRSEFIEYVWSLEPTDVIQLIRALYNAGNNEVLAEVFDVFLENGRQGTPEATIEGLDSDLRMALLHGAIITGSDTVFEQLINLIVDPEHLVKQIVLMIDFARERYLSYAVEHYETLIGPWSGLLSDAIYAMKFHTMSPSVSMEARARVMHAAFPEATLGNYLGLRYTNQGLLCAIIVEMLDDIDVSTLQDDYGSNAMNFVRIIIDDQV